MLKRSQLIRFIWPKLRKKKEYMTWKERIRNLAERRFSFVLIHSFIICSFLQTLSVLVMNPMRIAGFSTILIGLKTFEYVLNKDYFNEYRLFFGMCGVVGRMFLPLSPFVCSIVANFCLAQYIYLSICFNRQKKPGDISLSLGVSLSNAILMILAHKTVGSTIDITLFTPRYRFFFPIAGIFLLVFLFFQYYAFVHCKHPLEMDDPKEDNKIPVHVGVYWYDESPLKTTHFRDRMVVFGIFFSFYLFHFMFSSPLILPYYDLKNSMGYEKIVFIEVLTLLLFNYVTTFTPRSYGYLRKWFIRFVNWMALVVFFIWNFVSEFLDPFYFLVFLIPIFLFNFMFLVHQVIRRKLELNKSSYSHLFWSIFILFIVITLKIQLRKNYLFLIPLLIIHWSLLFLKKVSFVYFNDGVDECAIHEGDGEKNYKLRIISNIIGWIVFIILVINFTAIIVGLRTRLIRRFKPLDDLKIAVFDDENSFMKIVYEEERYMEKIRAFDILIVPEYSLGLENDFQDTMSYISHELEFELAMNVESSDPLYYLNSKLPHFVDGDPLVHKGFAVLSKFPVIQNKYMYENKYLLYKFAVGNYHCLTVLFERKPNQLLESIVDGMVVQKKEKLVYVNLDFTQVRDFQNEKDISITSESDEDDDYVRKFVIKMK